MLQLCALQPNQASSKDKAVENCRASLVHFKLLQFPNHTRAKQFHEMLYLQCNNSM